MTKAEKNRLMGWRLKVMRHASEVTKTIARTCRHFGISRVAFYRWQRRYEQHGEAGLNDRPRTPHRSSESYSTRGREQDFLPPAELPLRPEQDRGLPPP